MSYSITAYSSIGNIGNGTKPHVVFDVATKDPTPARRDPLMLHQTKLHQTLQCILYANKSALSGRPILVPLVMFFWNT